MIFFLAQLAQFKLLFRFIEAILQSFTCFSPLYKIKNEKKN